MPAVLFTICNPLLDISAVVPEDILKKYDVKLNNAILADEKHLPLYEELTHCKDVEYIAGGATQNTARVAQWLMKTPGSVVYMGCIGKDKFGQKLEAAARADGLNVQYLYDEATPTGTCAVLVVGKERSLIANLAAANHYKIDHLLQPANQALMEGARYYYNSGFFLTVSPQSAMHIACHAAVAHKTYCLNLSAPFICEVPIFKDRVNALLPFVDILFGNESEAEAYGRANHFADLSVAGIAARIAAAEPRKYSPRPRYVVFTQGAHETVVACSDGKVSKYPVPPVPDAEIVDSNGAGDAFVGGFLAQLVAGKPIEECVRCGHWAAGQIIRRSGCTIPSKAADYV